METIYDIFGNDLTSFYHLAEGGNFECVHPFSISDDYLEDMYFFVRLASFGDYDNSCHIERSNHRVILEMFPNCEDIYINSGHHYSEYLYIKATSTNKELIEIIEALENYPCLDEEDCTLVEREMFEDYFDYSLCDEFRNALKTSHNLDDIDTTNEELLEYFYELYYEQNLEYIIEAGGYPYFDMDSMDVSQPLPNYIK